MGTQLRALSEHFFSTHYGWILRSFPLRASNEGFFVSLPFTSPSGYMREGFLLRACIERCPSDQFK